MRKPAVLICVAIMLWMAFRLPDVRGDAIVVTKAMSATTIAEVFVEDESVRVELEIGAMDIEAFKNLLPDEIYDRFKFDDPQPYQKRVEAFFLNDLVLQADAAPLFGRVLSLTARKRILRDDVTGQPSAIQPDEGEIVVYAELEYKFDRQPRTITIQPTMNSNRGRVTANIGFITYHQGLPVMDFRYLSSSETLELDWEDPWFSKFQNRNLRRQYDAPLSVFLYVEPFEVRVEAVVRPVDLQRWTDLGVQPDQVIPISAQTKLKSRVADFLKQKVEVVIDGKRTDGKLDRIHFISRTLRKTGVVFPDQDLDGSSATLGVIFVFPIQQLPASVTMEWNLFDDKIPSVPSVATDEAGGLPWTLTAEDPLLEWRNFLTNPTIPAMLAVPSPPPRPRVSLPLASIGLLLLAALAALRWKPTKSRWLGGVTLAVLVLSISGAVLLWRTAKIQFADPFATQHTVTDQQAAAVTHSLIHNLYRSFDRRDESVIYDQLNTCVSGDLLREVYLQITKSVELENQGGALVKVSQVDVLETEFVYQQGSLGFQSNVKWNVTGSVGHWGHLHTRANQYVAEFGIEPVDGAWKINSMQVRDENQLETE